ncbi:MAG TPA: hypothetical protein VMF87_19345 [Streptosporangiaceae bacterium]|jgi:hypothetical protein|nr:hypothetical protein [Streptosporangiaceae bacterium]
MATYLWLDIPLMALIFAAICGIPLWMVIKHPDTGREIREVARRAEAIPLHAVSRHEAERWRESAAA